MEIWQAIVLGAVQGIAEFLPISSSGHLLLLQSWFGISAENATFFAIMLHIGTLIPAFIVLWKPILDLFKNKWKKFWLLALASIPAGCIGLPLDLLGIDTFFAENIWLLSITFTITAIGLVFAEKFARKKEGTEDINVKTALCMGCGQAVGVFSGISRSGATLTGGTFGRVKKEENASFTFLMSMPVIVVTVAYELFKIVIGESKIENLSVLPLVLGVFTAMITGYIAIKFMLKIIKKANYKWFSLYLILLSIANLLIYII